MNSKNTPFVKSINKKSSRSQTAPVYDYDFHMKKKYWKTRNNCDALIDSCIKYMRSKQY